MGQDSPVLVGLLASFFLFFESSGKGLDSGPILDIRGAICVHAFVHARIELVN